MVNSNSQTPPEDLEKKILLRLPLKSLVKLIQVSKKWASIIRGEEFRREYLLRSMTRPRVMLMVERMTSLPHEPKMSWFHDVYEEQRRNPGSGEYEVLFHSVYQEKKPSLSSGQQQLRIPFEKVGSNISQPIRGLTCLHLDTKVAICNPGTKNYRILPEIPALEDEEWRESSIKCFFGYDEDTNVFKVLCIKTRNLSSIPINDCHVLTVELGAEPSYWRRIICNDDHSPVTEALFKGGFLYYGAWSSTGNNLVVRFNVTSEEFTVWEPSEEVQRDADFSFPRWKFVIYEKDIALVDDFAFFPAAEIDRDGTNVFPILVIDEISGDFERKIIKIHGWQQKVGDDVFYFKGTIGTGELVFAQCSGMDGLMPGASFSVLYYDTKKFLRRSTIEAVAGEHILEARTFLDHVDSTWLM
ncbi:hypothetical protein ARALYDRAFT_894922 [Arabidopsis lyrata subsp. lyrata]|uniref:F-box domain-containing protein n=1 Tax=Arabidopsis lyrata subsp. lyrata TaxID=81972 RepID=D7KYG8_ARALL|nr:putative F-box protein At1g70970 [Arabidopsis lyrata subsp. lyrata]EFH63599.1 hypothetical protein ARALYDRAFT_894922 [Arabidopsis lyrata subsp. lyrata]|eukprot:XP_002887340.1 putative F-box protein At1g70970 [Arabidopsis lyrata subsp. lyrata]